MPTDEPVGVGLQQAVESVRSDLLAAQASGEDADVRSSAQKVTVQLRAVATREAGGKTGFAVDRHGTPVKVAQGSDQPKR